MTISIEELRKRIVGDKAYIVNVLSPVETTAQLNLFIDTIEQKMRHVERLYGDKEIANEAVNTIIKALPATATSAKLLSIFEVITLCALATSFESDSEWTQTTLESMAQVFPNNDGDKTVHEDLQKQ
ncbi:MAG TPA: hypothetical protein GXX18_05995 [Bacillales bacterium]|nr:hypothetical protein [Bacillales bacterium]